MSIQLSAGDIPVADRVETIREVVCAGVLPVDIRWDRPANDIDLAFKFGSAGPLSFNTARSSDNAMWRTARQAKSDHEANVFFAIQDVGSSQVSQGDRRSVLRPGDMVLYETTRPYSITNVGLTRLHYFQVSRSALGLPKAALDQVLGSRIGADNNPLAGIAIPFLTDLSASDVLDRPDAAELVAAPTLELLRAVVAAHVGDVSLGRSPIGTSLALRVRRHVMANLRDRDLTTESIAAAHHVSPRHLYNVMAREGVRLQELIRHQRLEACRRDLRDPYKAHLAVATICSRWGFADPSHFGRVFKVAYGMTPHEWRTAR